MYSKSILIDPFFVLTFLLLQSPSKRRNLLAITKMENIVKGKKYKQNNIQIQIIAPLFIIENCSKIINITNNNNFNS